MLNIVIACDHKQIRETLTRILCAQPIFNVMAVCADTHAAIAITCHQQPDIVLIDGSSDPLAAIEATKKIVGSSTANVVAFSREADLQFANHMLGAGALGYLTNNSSVVEIVTAVEEVAKDNLYCCLTTKHIAIETPARFSSFKKSIASVQNNARKKIQAASEIHWHSILKFTN